MPHREWMTLALYAAIYAVAGFVLFGVVLQLWEYAAVIVIAAGAVGFLHGVIERLVELRKQPVVAERVSSRDSTA